MAVEAKKKRGRPSKGLSKKGRNPHMLSFLDDSCTFKGLRPHQQKNVVEFDKAKKAAQGGLERMAKAYYKAVSADAGMKEVFKKLYPGLRPETFADMEALGSGNMHEGLFRYGGAYKARLRNLLPSEQRKLIEEGVDVVVDTPNGADIRHIRFDDLTPDQIKQITDGKCLRSESAQRTIVDNARVAKQIASNSASLAGAASGGATTAMSQPFSVVTTAQGGVLDVYSKCRITKAELKKLIKTM